MKQAVLMEFKNIITELTRKVKICKGTPRLQTIKKKEQLEV